MCFDDYWQEELEMYQKTIEMLFIHQTLYTKKCPYSFIGHGTHKLCQNTGWRIKNVPNFRTALCNRVK